MKYLGSISDSKDLVNKGYVDDSIEAGLEAVFKWLGVTTTSITDGSSTNPITINNESVIAVEGSVVGYNNSEFLFDGSNWKELGKDEPIAFESFSGPSSISSATTFTYGSYTYYKGYKGSVISAFPHYTGSSFRLEMESSIPTVPPTINTYDGYYVSYSSGGTTYPVICAGTGDESSITSYPLYLIVITTESGSKYYTIYSRSANNTIPAWMLYEENKNKEIIIEQELKEGSTNLVTNGVVAENINGLNEEVSELKSNIIYVTNPSKNIFNYQTDYSGSDVYFTNNNDGSFTCVDAGLAAFATMTLRAGTYTASISPYPGNDLGSMYIRLSTGSTNQKSVTFTLNEEQEIQLSVRSYGGDVRFYVQVETGSSASNYEPYAEVYTANDKTARKILENLETEMSVVTEKGFWVTPEMFGAIGNGTADDTQAVQDAVDSGFNVKFNGSKYYRINGEVVVNTPRITIDGNNCYIVSASRPQESGIFFVTADFVTVKNFYGVFPDRDYTYSASPDYVEISCNFIQFVRIKANYCNVSWIKTIGAMSAVAFYNEVGGTIYKYCTLSNIIALDCDMGVQLYNCDNVQVSNIRASIQRYHSHFHPIYICRNVSNCTLNNIILFAPSGTTSENSAYDLLSIHPASDQSTAYANLGIYDINISNVLLYGAFDHAIEVSQAYNVKISDVTIRNTTKTYTQQSTISFVLLRSVYDCVFENVSAYGSVQSPAITLTPYPTTNAGAQNTFASTVGAIFRDCEFYLYASKNEGITFTIALTHCAYISYELCRFYIEGNSRAIIATTSETDCQWAKIIDCKFYINGYGTRWYRGNYSNDVWLINNKMYESMFPSSMQGKAVFESTHSDKIVAINNDVFGADTLLGDGVSLRINQGNNVYGFKITD